MWARVKTEIERQDDLLLWMPVAALAGAAAYFALPYEPAHIWPAFAGAGIAIGLSIYLRAAYRAVPVMALAALFGVAMLAFGAAQVRTHLLYAAQLSAELGPVYVSGIIRERGVEADDTDGPRTQIKLLLDDVIVDNLPADSVPRRIKLSTWHMDNGLVPGDRVMVLAKLMPPSPPAMPDGFDFRRQAYFQGVGASGFTLGDFTLLRKGQTGAVDNFFARLRVAIARRFEASAPSPVSAILIALVTGDTSMIASPTLNVFRDSGLQHLLSVSGVHVAIVCGFVFFLLRFFGALVPRIALYWPVKKIAAGVALSVGIFYTLLAGAQVPTVRAMIMTAIVLCGVMLDRITVSLRVLALAALILILLVPDAVTGASFQLSFAAMLSLVAFYDGAQKRFLVAGHHASVFRHAYIYVLALFVTSVIATLATAPFVAAAFGRVQGYGVLSNAIAVPLTGFLTMPALFGALLFWATPLCEVLLHWAAWSMELILKVAQWTAALPHAVVYVPAWPRWAFGVMVCGYLFFFLWRGVLRWAGVVIVAAMCAVPFVYPQPDVFIYPQGPFAAVRQGEDIVYLGAKAPTLFVRNQWRQAWGLPPEVKGHREKPIKDAGVYEGGGVRIACTGKGAQLQCSVQKETGVWRWPEDLKTIRGEASVRFGPRQTAVLIQQNTRIERPWGRAEP